MDDEKYVCPKCGCEQIYIKQTAKYPGAYCFHCNSWIKWLSYPEVLRITKGKITECTENNAVKMYHKYDGVITVRCSNCRTKLYTSDSPITKGQFNLINATYCPVCGKEFI